MTDIQWRPSDRRLRQFSVLCVAFSSALMIRWISRLGQPSSMSYRLAFLLLIGLAIVLLLGLVGIFKPAFIRPLYVGWMIGVLPISWTVSKLILAVLFYGVFTPLGLFFRILGRDALGLKLQPETDSYWIPKETPDDLGRYFQQF